MQLISHQYSINLSAAITVAELYFGAYNSQRVVENLARAEDFIQNLPVLPLTDLALKKYGELKAELRKIGQTIAEFDLLIASVALAENSDFSRYVEKPRKPKPLTPFPTREGGKFKISLLKGERFRERFSRYREKSVKYFEEVHR